MDNADEVLGQMARIVATHTKTVSMLGARSMVLGAFFDAAVPHLASAQRAEVTRSFRQRIEEALAQMDDMPLPGEYHSTLLELTNSILDALGPESGGCR
jgi:hypothetical protein